MSLRLRLLNWCARWIARPMLQRTGDAERARREFDWLAHFLRVTPYTLYLVDGGPVPLHLISVRRHRMEWVILYLHGGAYVSGSPRTHLGMMARLAKLTEMQVAAPQYRLAPEHPAPAAFDDAVTAHARLIQMGYPAERIILGGDSAGGGLALALMADLCGRGLAPAGLFAFSPWTDFALTGASLQTNAARDPLLPPGRMPEVVAMVLGCLDARDPRISPLYATYDAPPPVFIQVGVDEILLDDSRRMAEVLRQAGGTVTVQEWPDCPHVWQMLDGYLPEARQALIQTADFIDSLSTPQSCS
ncbi:MAG: alpha/beta hydrolase [Pseudorhodobacter sp.]|nr:alpha/beta hydrolase [Pseudorhodobacter sp.]